MDADQNVLPWEVKKKPVDEDVAVTIELQPNHASLHDGRLLHGSPPNTTALRRCGYTMRYMPATVELSDAAQETHKIYLARGRDRAGNKYMETRRRDMKVCLKPAETRADIDDCAELNFEYDTALL